MIKYVFAGLMALAIAPTALADDPRISIQGTGTVAAVPDHAVLIVAIETVADQATEAQAQNSTAAAEAITALRTSGVRAQDLRTTSFSVSPVYARSSAGDGQPRITGYRVVNRIAATIYNIPGLGDVLDKVVQTGANRVDGLQFGVTNVEELRDEARRRAVAEATRRAHLYAEEMGVILGPVQMLTEGGSHMPGPMPMAESRVATPILPGSLEVSAMVTMTWTIFDR